MSIASPARIALGAVVLLLAVLAVARPAVAQRWPADKVPITGDRDDFANPVNGAVESLQWGQPGDIPVGRGAYWAYR